MRVRKAYFDGGAFAAALDAQRRAKGLNWKQVASQANVSASTLTRLTQGKRPDVDSLAALATWSGFKVDDFLKEGAQEGAPEVAAMISTYLRSDPHLSSASADAIAQVIQVTYNALREGKPGDESTEGL